jgi:hypothetical protein
VVTDFPELPPPTDRFADLSESEQLVVNCFRRWLAGPGHREALWRTLSRELEPAAARTALQGLEATIRALTAHASRNISYHRPCCPCVGPDEVGLLTLVTSVQRGQPELARHVAANFVPAERIGLVIAAVGVFATALADAEVQLPLRYAFCSEAEIAAEPVRTPVSPTLH